MSALVWRHPTNPVWVRFYPEVEGVRLAFYQAYRAVQPVPKGREPWIVDNRRIGTDRGFASVEEAIAAAEAHPF